MISAKKNPNKEKEKQLEREQAERETYVLATRFIAFEEGCVVVM